MALGQAQAARLERREMNWWHQHHPRNGWQRPGGLHSPRPLSPEDIFSLTRQPELRWQDIPHGDSLAEQLMLNPGDAALAEVFELAVRQQAGQAMLAGDLFIGNYPSHGQIPPLLTGRIPFCAMPRGGVLSVSVQDATRNILVVGPTGSGKTSWLRLLVASLLEGT